ncbi:MAG: [FeFe] hydrogenase H-cluster maturation GTPase HydF, partial [Anaerotignum faecicola]
VVPIDSAAPKGRLILPQQQTIRDILEAGAVSIVTRDFELAETLAALGKCPKLVITDSQIFGKVSKIVPEDIPLTSFSILMARYKGNLEQNVKGARALEQLKNGDTVLISEGCTHHRQCEDIGTVKLPRWIREYTGKELQFQFTSGGTFPADLSPYALIVHCGGCMLNEKEMQHRLSIAKEQGAKMTNYGICIAYIHGILERSLAPLGL